MPSASPHPRAALFGLDSGFIRRLNHDDFAFYTVQWKALTILMDGMRAYIEEQVIPALLRPHNH